MNKHSLTLNNGTIKTRNSKARVYTHAVVAVVTEEMVAYTQKQLDAWLARRDACLSGCWTAEEFDAKTAQMRAELEELVVGDDYGVMTWSGSQRLAEKAAATQRRGCRGLCYEVRPVTLS